MKGKIKIRTMRDDLADNKEENLSRENQEQDKIQSQNKASATDITNMKSVAREKAVGLNVGASSFGDVSADFKMKEDEINELQNIVKRISNENRGKSLKTEEGKNIQTETGKQNRVEEQSFAQAQTETKATKAIKTEEKNELIEEEKEEKIIANRKEELRSLINKISRTIKAEEKESDEVSVAESEDKMKGDEYSFWSDISEKLKNDKLSPHEDTRQQAKIEDIKDTKSIIEKEVERSGNIMRAREIEEIEKIKKDIKPDDRLGIKETGEEKISSVENVKLNIKEGVVSSGEQQQKETIKINSGILEKTEQVEKNKKQKEQAEEMTKGNRRAERKHNVGYYQSPENRLIWGKQERYGSVSKKIKPKEKSDNLKGLTDINEAREKERIVSENEEYRELKNQVIRKYHIKLFTLPWIKIILISIILIVLVGASFYFFVKKITPPPTENPPVVIGVNIDIFDKIKGEIEISKDDVAKVGFKENVINKKFKSDPASEELKIIIKDNGNIVPLKDALESIKIKTSDFPESFWKTTKENYNIIALKTNENDFRIAVAIESKDISSLLETMREWERESVAKRKMFSVFESLFVGDKTEESFYPVFRSSNYNYVYIRFINLSNENTSFDYFAINDILIFTTSKENAFRLVDILNSDN